MPHATQPDRQQFAVYIRISWQLYCSLCIRTLIVIQLLNQRPNMDRTHIPNVGGIVLQRMIEGPEMRSPGDDWTGKTSTIERRKIQNKLAQRIFSMIERKHVNLILNWGRKTTLESKNCHSRSSDLSSHI